MVIEYSGGEKEEREVEGLCGFYRLELSLLEGPFSSPKNWLTSRCHLLAHKDEFLEWFSRIPSDRPNSWGLEEDVFYISWGQLSLYRDALQVEKCKGYLPTDGYQNVQGSNWKHGRSLYWRHGGQKQERWEACNRPNWSLRNSEAT